MIAQMQIHGIAIREGVSKNGILYTAEELNKFAPTLEGKPILKDHRSAVDNTVGLVERTSGEAGIVNYNGWIKEDGTGLLEKVKDGRAKEVSIGAFVHKLVKENDDDEFVTAIGIEAMELSITPTPAMTGTSLRQSLESLEKNKIDKKFKIKPVLEKTSLFESYKKNESKDSTDNEEVIEMAEDDKPKEQPIEEPKEEPKEETPKEEPKEEAKEESTSKVTIEVDNSNLDETITKLQKIADLKEKVSEKKIVEESKVKEDSTKGKITEDVEEETEEKAKETTADYVVEQCEYSEGASLWKEPKADGSYL